MVVIEKMKPLAIRAHMGTSFSPDQRGAQMIKEYSDDLAQLLTEIDDEHHDWVTAKYVDLLSAWWHAKSRCISTMITGASNFPVRRAQKFNNWEEGHYNAFADWRNSIAAKLKRKAAREHWSLESEIHRLENEIEILKTKQERMKAANKILRSKGLTEEEQLDELQNIGFNEVPKGGFLNEAGFPSFRLTNNLAKIKSREARIAELQKRIQARELEPVEKTMNGIRVVENVAENRLQLFFPGIPSKPARVILKRYGFRWSPNSHCWQSYLNGKWKLQTVLNQIESCN